MPGRRAYFLDACSSATIPHNISVETDGARCASRREETEDISLQSARLRAEEPQQPHDILLFIARAEEH